MLAHSCGLEATLRVLTHSDATFYEICKPNIDLTQKLELAEDKLKVKFGPADIERWLQSGSRRPMGHNRSITIDNYEVTIFPAESVNHTHTLPAISASTSLKDKTDPEMKNPDSYSTWFFDLQGKNQLLIVTKLTANTPLLYLRRLRHINNC